MKKRIAELEKVNDELRNAYVKESQYKKAVLYDAVSFFEVNLSKDRFASETTQVAKGEAQSLYAPSMAQKGFGGRRVRQFLIVYGTVKRG